MKDNLEDAKMSSDSSDSDDSMESGEEDEIAKLLQEVTMLVNERRPISLVSLLATGSYGYVQVHCFCMSFYC